MPLKQLIEGLTLHRPGVRDLRLRQIGLFNQPRHHRPVAVQTLQWVKTDAVLSIKRHPQQPVQITRPPPVADSNTRPKRTKNASPDNRRPDDFTTGSSSSAAPSNRTRSYPTRTLTTTPPDQAKPHPPKDQKTSPMKALKEAPGSKAPRRWNDGTACGQMDTSRPR